MPSGDRTGPQGAGPMTGRGLGFCTGYKTPGYANSTRFASRRWFFPRFWCFGGAGAGRGWRNMYYATGLPGWMRLGSAFRNPFQFLGFPTPQATAESSSVSPEKDALRAQANWLKSSLEWIEKRLQELEAQDKTQ